MGFGPEWEEHLKRKGMIHVDGRKAVVYCAPRVGESPRTMYRSKAEARFAEYLKALTVLGKVTSWEYEPLRIRLGSPRGRCWWTPDFAIRWATGGLDLVDVKARWRGSHRAHWEDDARVKAKVVARLWPEWRVVGVHEACGEWMEEVVR